MNGCLFKSLLIMTAIVGLFFGYPYLKAYTSESMQGKISNWEMTGEVIKKFVTQVVSGKIAEQQKDFQPEDQQKNNQKTDENKK